MLIRLPERDSAVNQHNQEQEEDNCTEDNKLRFRGLKSYAWQRELDARRKSDDDNPVELISETVYNKHTV